MTPSPRAGDQVVGLPVSQCVERLHRHRYRPAGRFADFGVSAQAHARVQPEEPSVERSERRRHGADPIEGSRPVGGRGSTTAP